MREVKAIVRPQRLEHVLAALQEIAGLPGVTVSKVHAHAGTRPTAPSPQVTDAQTDFAKLEIFLPNSLVADVVRAITRAAHTGRAGDGIVAILPVDEFVRIRDVGTEDS